MGVTGAVLMVLIQSVSHPRAFIEVLLPTPKRVRTLARRLCHPKRVYGAFRACMFDSERKLNLRTRPNEAVCDCQGHVGLTTKLVQDGLSNPVQSKSCLQKMELRARNHSGIRS